MQCRRIADAPCRISFGVWSAYDSTSGWGRRCCLRARGLDLFPNLHLFRQPPCASASWYLRLPSWKSSSTYHRAWSWRDPPTISPAWCVLAPTAERSDIFREKKQTGTNMAPTCGRGSQHLPHALASQHRWCGGRLLCCVAGCHHHELVRRAWYCLAAFSDTSVELIAYRRHICHVALRVVR